MEGVRNVIGDSVKDLQLHWNSSYWWRSQVNNMTAHIREMRCPDAVKYLHAETLRYFLQIKSRVRDVTFSYIEQITGVDVSESISRIDFLLRSKFTHPNLVCFLAGASIGVLLGFLIAFRMNQIEFRNRVRSLGCIAYSGLKGVALIDDFPVRSKCRKYEVIVQVRAASVDPVDLRITHGYGRLWRNFLFKKWMLGKKVFPLSLGRDFSGVIAEIGSGVRDLEVGEHVWGATPFWYQGCLAELICVPEQWVGRKPKTLGHEGAAAVPYSGIQSWEAILGRRLLEEKPLKGKRVLVHGGSTPSGCLTVQLAVLAGAEVTITVPSHAVDVISQLEVDQVFVMQDTALFKLIGVVEGFHVVINCYETDYSDVCQQLCTKDGRVGSTTSKDLKSDGFGFIRKCIFNSWWRFFYLFMSPSLGPMPERKLLDRWSELIDSGKIQPVIDRAFPFHNAEAAIHFSSRSNAVGKTVVIMRNRIWVNHEEDL
ncbi:reticulon-4-interacting protein 1, mitochondrial-like [Artemia franciscana]|uniref:reticulon-4-interacting protein 1, mitochondrial-like n=1 Tax=Artemia franciscana TaxID=6661 RepID=UPI0032DBC227